MSQNDNDLLTCERKRPVVPPFSTFESERELPLNPALSSGELERKRNDLSCRLVHDRAAMATLLEQTEARAAILRNSLSELDEQIEQLSLMLPVRSESSYATKLEQLTMRYWRNSGKFAYLLGEKNEKKSSEKEEIISSERPLGVLMREAIPHIIGLIVAALIVSGAMALIFS